METKEVVKVVEKKVENATSQVSEIAITDETSLTAGTEMLANVKKLAKFVTGEKEKITKPMNEALKAARALFAGPEKRLADAESTLKGKIIAYTNEVEKKRKEAEAKIAARVEKGTMKAETALGKIADLEVEKKAVHTEAGSAKISVVRKVRFHELKTLTPDMLYALAQGGFLEWNEVAARKAALDGNLALGVEVYEDKQVSVGV